MLTYNEELDILHIWWKHYWDWPKTFLVPVHPNITLCLDPESFAILGVELTHFKSEVVNVKPMLRFPKGGTPNE